jgi:hypothetical protein
MVHGSGSSREAYHASHTVADVYLPSPPVFASIIIAVHSPCRFLASNSITADEEFDIMTGDSWPSAVPNRLGEAPKEAGAGGLVNGSKTDVS